MNQLAKDFEKYQKNAKETVSELLAYIEQLEEFVFQMSVRQNNFEMMVRRAKELLDLQRRN